jgi:putative pyruvate formate lyase activating enzyme
VVYNTSSYEKVEVLRVLGGIVDIYLADFKLWSREVCQKYLKAPDYSEVARKAIKEMYSQVGDLVLDQAGLAKRGLIVRHLVIPGALKETEAVLRWLAEEISPRIHLNLMGHYHPAGKAKDYPPLDRPLKRREYYEALELAQSLGFENLDETHRGLLELILTD